MTEGRPLDGLVVADLSRVLAGPTAAVMLADLGARVIKVERPVTGDDTRQWGPPWIRGGPAGSSSSYFESANRSKQSIALDFGDDGDLRIARALVDRADVVIENYRSGALARHGLDAAAVSERNPRVVYVSITGFGSGAGAELPGYDFLLQAVGGLMSITGQPDGPPTKVGVAVVDLLAAKDVVMGVLAAIIHREKTGRGQHVEVNLLSSAVASLANQASAYLTTGTSPGRSATTTRRSRRTGPSGAGTSSSPSRSAPSDNGPRWPASSAHPSSPATCASPPTPPGSSTAPTSSPNSSAASPGTTSRAGSGGWEPPASRPGR